MKPQYLINQMKIKLLGLFTSQSSGEDKVHRYVLKLVGSLLAMVSVEAGFSFTHLSLVHQIYICIYLTCKSTPLA